ncbi:hypothetical protein V9T40_001631 [Parthenolecanium corni]|uniref:Uncharacterized protein n=1 Tax=Parthenolecanium corni TaxID=536013 RepID=A0AAN9Y4S3_9HEMI
MPSKKKALISGEAPNMPSSYLESLSDFSSDEEELQPQSPLNQQQQPLVDPQQQSTSTSTADTDVSSQTQPNATVIIPTPNQLTDTSPVAPSQNTSPPEENISKLLDEMAANIREINCNVEQYNDIMEKTSDYLKIRYSDILTQENIDTLKTFLFHTCSTNKPSSAGKHRLLETGEKVCSKKRKM